MADKKVTLKSKTDLKAMVKEDDQEGIEKYIQDLDKHKQEIREAQLDAHGYLDEILRLRRVRNALSGLEDSDLSALRQVVEVEGLPSVERVSEPSAKS